MPTVAYVIRCSMSSIHTAGRESATTELDVAQEGSTQRALRRAKDK